MTNYITTKYLKEYLYKELYMNLYPLSETWILWYHHVHDNNWQEESYTKLCELENIEDYWKMMNTIKTFTSGMFFLMKKDVFPRWEDINNIDGGYWSFRITKKDTDNIWRNLCATLIGNSLTKDIDSMTSINGISLSPKINNCIIKVWNNDFKISDVNIFNDKIEGLVINDGLYKKHQDQNDFNCTSKNENYSK